MFPANNDINVEIYNNGSTWTAGKVGPYALQLQGDPNYAPLLVSGNLDMVVGGTASIGFWIRTTQVGSNTLSAAPGLIGGEDISGTNEIYWGVLDAAGRIGLGVGESRVSSTKAINDGQWHHVALTRNAATGAITIYVDGFLDASGTLAVGEQGVSRGYNFIGAMMTNNPAVPTLYGGLNAAIDDFKAVEDKVWNATDVALLYDPSGQPPVTPTSLTAPEVGTIGVRLNWGTPAPNASGYRIEKSEAGGPFVEAKVTGPVGTDVVTGLTPNTEYTFRVIGYNPHGNSPEPYPTVTVTTKTPVAAGNGTGLLGVYYDNGGLPTPGSNPAILDPFNSGNFTGRVAYRIDPFVGFDGVPAGLPTTNWGTGPAVVGFGPDQFSVRWTGQVQAQYTETYTFYSRTDDGSFLYIDLNDGQGLRKIIDDPYYHGANPADERASAPLQLVAGQKYTIVYEMFENGGGAAAQLSWESLSTPKSYIPQSQLFPPVQSLPAAPSGLSAYADGPFRIVLNWTDNSTNEIGFKVLRSTQQNGTYVEVARVADAFFTDLVYPNQTFFYKVQSFNLAGDSALIGPSNSATTASLPTGPGLLGTYFNNTNLTWAPDFVRVDGDVTWAGATGVINWPDLDATPTSPLSTGVAGIDDGENLSIRWEGLFRAPADGAYTFYTRTDDDVRLYLDGKILIARPTPDNFLVGRGAPAAPGDASSPVTLVAGQSYPIIMEYRQGGGSAVAELRWQGPGMTSPALLSVNGTPAGATQVLTAAVTPPSAPTNLSAVSGAVSIVLRWQDNSKNEYTNRIEMSTDGGNTWTTVVDKGGVDVTSSGVFAATYAPRHQVTGLTPSTEYKFRITAMNTAGTATSQILTASTTAKANMVANVADSSGDTDLPAEGNYYWGHYGQGGDPLVWVSNPGAPPPTTPPNPVPFPLITNVVETGGDNEATDTIQAKWTGQTWNTTIANEPLPNTPVGTPFTLGYFQHYAPTFVDRNHRYANISATVPIPAYLVGGEYIMSGNDNRDNAGYRLDITVSTPVTAYILIDNRQTDGNNATPPRVGAGAQQWLLDQGWAPTSNGLNRAGDPARPDELGIDENADGSVNQYYSVWYKQFDAGTFSMFQADAAGRNMYGVVIKQAGGTNITPLPIGSPTSLIQPAETPGKTFTWTGGRFVSSATATDDAIAVSGAGNGMRFTVPASAVAKRQLKVYVAADETTGLFTATTSDGSINTYTDSSVVDSGPGITTKVYTLEFRTEIVGSTVTIDWISQGAGSVMLSAVTLSEIEPPVAPTFLDAVQVQGGGIQVNWADNATNEANYQLERKTGVEGAYTVIATLPPNTVSYVDAGVHLIPGTEYFYRVRAFGSGGPSEYSNEDSAVESLPGAPVNIVAGPDDGQITVFWVPQPYVDAYNVKRSTSASGPFTTVATVQGNSYVDSVPNFQRFYYVVSSIKSGFEGPDSTVVVNARPAPMEQWVKINFTNNTDDTREDLQGIPAGYLFDYGYEFGTFAYEPTDPTYTPYQQYVKDGVVYQYGWGDEQDWDNDGIIDYFAPVNHTAYARDRDSADSGGDERLDSLNHLQRTEAGAADAWEIALPNGEYRVLIAGGDATAVDNYISTMAEGVLAAFGLPTTANRFIIGVHDSGLFVDVVVTDGRLTINSNRALQVGLFNNKINFIDIYKIQAAPVAPNAPTNLAADALANGNIGLTWTDNATNEKGFVIQRKEGVDGTYAPIGTVDRDVTTYVDADPTLVPGVEYWYRVAAYTPDIQSDWSNEDPAVKPLGAPVGLSGFGRDGGVELNWTTPYEGLTITYTVKRTEFDTTTGQAVAGTETTLTSGLGAVTYFDATAVAGKSYFYDVSGKTGASTSLPARVLATALPGRKFVSVNFTLAGGQAYTGYVQDVGNDYSAQNGFTYGWTPIVAGSQTSSARNRNDTSAPLPIDERYDSFNHLQNRANEGPQGVTWEIAVPNGTYYIHVVGGDISNTNNNIGFAFEKGTPNQALTGVVPIRTVPGEASGDGSPVQWRFAEFYVTVVVTDGKLTLSTDTISSLANLPIDPATGAPINVVSTTDPRFNNKIAYIEINTDVPATSDWVIDLTDADDVRTLTRSGDDVQLRDAGNAVVESRPISSIENIIINARNGNDLVTFDAAVAAFVAAGKTVTFNGGGGNDTIGVIGTAGGSNVTATAAGVSFDGKSVVINGVENLAVGGSAATNTLTVTDGSFGVVGAANLNVVAQNAAAISFKAATTLKGLNLQGTSRATLAQSGTHILTTGGLSIASGATLDIADNGVVVKNGNLAAIQTLVMSGATEAFDWTGTGITSSAAADSASALYQTVGIGAIINNYGDGTQVWDAWRGVSGLAVTDVLISYTWYGDANLDGQLEGFDFALQGVGFTGDGSGWLFGDIKMDGAIEGFDFALMGAGFTGSRVPGDATFQQSLSLFDPNSGGGGGAVVEDEEAETIADAAAPVAEAAVWILAAPAAWAPTGSVFNAGSAIADGGVFADDDDLFQVSGESKLSELLA